MKKLIVGILTLVLFGLPVLLAGCEKDEVHIERQKSVQDKIVSQETVVQ